MKEKTAPPSKVAPFSKTAPGWSRFVSTFFSVYIFILLSCCPKVTPQRAAQTTHINLSRYIYSPVSQLRLGVWQNCPWNGRFRVQELLDHAFSEMIENVAFLQWDLKTLILLVIYTMLAKKGFLLKLSDRDKSHSNSATQLDLANTETSAPLIRLCVDDEWRPLDMICFTHQYFS